MSAFRLDAFDRLRPKADIIRRLVSLNGGSNDQLDRVEVPRLSYSHLARLKRTYSAMQVVTMTVRTTKYPYRIVSSGMFSKFMP